MGAEGCAELRGCGLEKLSVPGWAAARPPQMPQSRWQAASARGADFARCTRQRPVQRAAGEQSKLEREAN